jgi:hypothetical protein
MAREGLNKNGRGFLEDLPRRPESRGTHGGVAAAELGVRRGLIIGQQGNRNE